TEMAYAMRDAVEAGQVDELGPMLDDAFESKKRMNPHVAEHTPIEAMLAAAREAGATGGKICGAGGGGYLLIAGPPAARGSLRERRKSRGRAASGHRVRQHAHDRQPEAVDPGDRPHDRHVAVDRDRERLRCRGDLRPAGRVAGTGGGRVDGDLHERELGERDP